MDEAKPTDHKTEYPVELVSHYRPLGLKAVVAACAVKAQPTPSRPESPEMFGNLPEGFHMPHGLDN